MLPPPRIPATTEDDEDRRQRGPRRRRLPPAGTSSRGSTACGWTNSGLGIGGPRDQNAGMLLIARACRAPSSFRVSDAADRCGEPGPASGRTAGNAGPGAFFKPLFCCPGGRAETTWPSAFASTAPATARTLLQRLPWIESNSAGPSPVPRWPRSPPFPSGSPGSPGTTRRCCAASARWLATSREHHNYTYDLTKLNRDHLAWFVSVVCDVPVGQVRDCFAEIERRRRRCAGTSRPPPPPPTGAAWPTARSATRAAARLVRDGPGPRPAHVVGDRHRQGTGQLCPGRGPAAQRRGGCARAGSPSLDINPEAGYLARDARPGRTWSTWWSAISVTRRARWTARSTCSCTTATTAAPTNERELRRRRAEAGPGRVPAHRQRHQPPACCRARRAHRPAVPRLPGTPRATTGIPGDGIGVAW